MQPSTLRDLLLLTIVCVLLYFLGLTNHGLTNWQEAQRALVPRDMHARGDWIVPSIDGRPYLAKPPMVYWSQLVIASLRGVPPGEFELRLTVALGAWLGVLATYLVARRILGALAARWSSLFLATGILYVHSARVGELDILLVPLVVVAAGAVYLLWRTNIEHRRTNIGALATAIIASCAAMLTKGPPALLIIALAGYGGIALAKTWRENGTATPPDNGAGPPSGRMGNRRLWLVSIFISLIIVALSVWLHRSEKWDANAVAGLVLLAALLPGAIATLIRLAVPKRLLAVLRASGRAHAIAILAIPFIVLYGWGKIVETRIGAAAVKKAVKTETAENFLLLVPDSSFHNLLSASFGVGLGSFTGVLAVAWLLRARRSRSTAVVAPLKRGASSTTRQQSAVATTTPNIDDPGSEQPSITPALWFLLAWVGGSLVAFSVLGKGVPRYLTPVWPGMAMLGGWWFASMLTKARSPRWLAAAGVALVLILTVGQSWWYAYGRERLYGERSPRAIARELLALPNVEASRVAAFEFKTPMLDYYMGQRVPAFYDIERSLDQLRARCAASERPFILLLRERQPPRKAVDPRPASDRLRAAGFELEPLSLHSRFTIDKWHIPVITVRVRSVSG